jgi:predicted esterase
MSVHIFHGTKDKVVPYESAEKLRKYLKHYDSFLTIPCGGHKDLPTFSVYQSRLTEILR